MKNEVTYKGINYGPCVNINPKTNIRYGVIPMNKILQAWSDESEPYYGDPCCPECGAPAQPSADPSIPDEMECTECICTFPSEHAYLDEPLSWDVCTPDYDMVCDDHGDIFVIRSPFFTYAQFCSPCAPGACHLLYPLAPLSRNPDNKCYCVGHDWFEDGIAPYDVFSVKTGQLVTPREV